MKKLLLSFLALTAGILPLAAQNWAPFKLGRTPYFQAGDSIYSLRITNASVQSSDSVFEFNPRVVPSNGNSTQPGCNGNPAYGNAARSFDNLFGRKMVKNSSNEYTFVFQNGQTFLLKPWAAIGQGWQFSDQLTATMAAKIAVTVLGQPDSAARILLSNGDSIIICRNSGLVYGRSFVSYLNNQALQNGLLLTRLPEAGLGNPLNHPYSIYDFQPGDKFLHHYHEAVIMGTTCYEYWTTTEIVSRHDNAQTDSIWYRIRRQTLTKTYGTPGAPFGFCSGTTSTNLSGFDTVTFVVKPNQVQHLFDLSREYTIRPAGSYLPSPNTGQYVSQFNSRLGTSFSWMVQDTCMATYMIMPDGDGNSYFAEGLGLVKVASYNWTNQDYNLIAYIKGAETYGNWQPLVLGAEDEIAENPVQVYPNPFSDQLSVRLPHDQPAEITLYNLQGQKIQVLQTNGNANLQLPEIPDGLYVLHVKQGQRSYTTKIQKQ